MNFKDDLNTFADRANTQTFFTVVKSNADRENDLQEKTLNKIDIS